MPARPRIPGYLLTDRLALLRAQETRTWSGATVTWQSVGTVPALVLPARGGSQGQLAVYGEQYRGLRRLRAWVDARELTGGATAVVAGMRTVVDGVSYVVVDVQATRDGLVELWLAEAVDGS